MKEWFRKRQTFTHLNLLKELRVCEPVDFRKILRMVGIIDNFLNKVTPYTEKH